MKIKLFPILITIFFITIFFIFYKGLENSNIYTPKINEKKNIPSFEARLFETDELISSGEIFKKDKFYLMNIWASWCVPCKEEHPFLLNLSNENNIEIIGLNYKDDNENAKKFLKNFSSPYKFILSDTNGLIAIEWGAYGVPESFVIFNNEIIKKVIGPLNINSLLEIKELIK